MKRKIAIVMVSVLTVLTLAACGDKASTDTSTSTNTEAPVVAEPVESVAESVAEESVTSEPIIVQDAEGAREYNHTVSAAEYANNLNTSTAEKYHLELDYNEIVLDGDTPTEVLEALLNEEELGLMVFAVESKYYVDPEDPEFRQEIQDVLVKNEELKYSNN